METFILLNLSLPFLKHYNIVGINAYNMHMQNTTIKSIFASIDTQRDALRCENAIVRYYAHIELLALEEHHYPNGRVHVRPVVILKRTKDDVPAKVEAYKILKPKAGETLPAYLDRLMDHVDYLDDHALFIEVAELCNA